MIKVLHSHLHVHWHSHLHAHLRTECSHWFCVHSAEENVGCSLQVCLSVHPPVLVSLSSSLCVNLPLLCSIPVCLSLSNYPSLALFLCQSLYPYLSLCLSVCLSASTSESTFPYNQHVCRCAPLWVCICFFYLCLSMPRWVCLSLSVFYYRYAFPSACVFVTLHLAGWQLLFQCHLQLGSVHFSAHLYDPVFCFSSMGIHFVSPFQILMDENRPYFLIIDSRRIERI